jgi:transcriptional regulator with PAS, ATPase and Fis domain
LIIEDKPNRASTSSDTARQFLRLPAEASKDITDLKRAEADLRQADHRLQRVLKSITDGMAILDKNWRYTYFNEQGALIIGMRPEQLLGGCIWELFPHAQGTIFTRVITVPSRVVNRFTLRSTTQSRSTSGSSATATRPTKAWPSTFAMSPTANGLRRQAERSRKDTNGNHVFSTRRFRPSLTSFTSLTGTEGSFMRIKRF